MAASERLILGTVQFGLRYGINNRRGQVSAPEVQNILSRAHDAGIRHLDTAAAYGDAAARIGAFHRADERRFSVITKFKSAQRAAGPVLKEQLATLGVEQAFGYLFHSPDALRDDPDSLAELVHLRRAGLIRHIGVSIYTNEQFDTAINTEAIDLIQLPYNLLDNRRRRGELIDAAKAAGKLVHTRSVFLQGLFFKKPDKLPQALLGLRDELVELRDIAHRFRLTTAQLGLGYALANPQIDGVLIGVDGLGQLEVNLAAAAQPLPAAAIAAIDDLYVSNPRLLNPSNWS